MAANYSAVIQERDGLWLGWVEEVPGVNAQSPTRDELMEDLRSALAEALKMNRADGLS